jgi:xylulokinase
MSKDEPLLLGLDVSTTGSKALLIDHNGAVRAAAGHPHPISTPRPGWSEQDPADWWTASRSAIRKALAAVPGAADRVAAIGLTGQMHGSVLLDEHGDVVRPALLWNDQRTADQCAELNCRVGAERILELTGNPMLTGFTAPKLLWVQQREPEAWSHVRQVLLPKDYVRYRLSDVYATDVADASGTALLEVAKRAWAAELVAALDLPAGCLPELAEGPAVVAAVSAEGAEQAGLAEGTPIVAGAGDQAAQAIGTGIVEEGLISATLGTSGVVFAASERYRLDPQGKLHAFCHAVPGMWHLMGVMLSAGGSLAWYEEQLCAAERQEAAAGGVDVYDLLLDKASQVPAGAEGLIFLPYLTGERTPHADPHARGVFFGLSNRHTKAHLTRAVVEGISLGLRDALELMRGLGIVAHDVRVSGGGARNGWWRQLLADIFSSPISTMNLTEGAAFGAALLAGVGAGVYASVPEACTQTLRCRDTVMPAPERDHYDVLYRTYTQLYPALRSQFASLQPLRSITRG